VKPEKTSPSSWVTLARSEKSGSAFSPRSTTVSRVGTLRRAARSASLGRLASSIRLTVLNPENPAVVARAPASSMRRLSTEASSGASRTVSFAPSFVQLSVVALVRLGKRSASGVPMSRSSMRRTCFRLSRRGPVVRPSCLNDSQSTVSRAGSSTVATWGSPRTKSVRIVRSAGMETCWRVALSLT
jgi:hypothetical protein